MCWGSQPCELLAKALCCCFVCVFTQQKDWLPPCRHTGSWPFLGRFGTKRFFSLVVADNWPHYYCAHPNVNVCSSFASPEDAVVQSERSGTALTGCFRTRSINPFMCWGHYSVQNASRANMQYIPSDTKLQREVRLGHVFFGIESIFPREDLFFKSHNINIFQYLWKYNMTSNIYILSF